MAKTSDIRNGLMIRFRNDVYMIVEFLHVKPGKGGAFVRTKLRNMNNGAVIDYTFDSGENIDTVRVERQKFQYLYTDGEKFTFMNLDSFEQIELDKARIDNIDLLKENAECELLIDTDKDVILTIELPTFIEAEITYTEPGLKGDTAGNTLKPATLETGAVIRVPLFVNLGDRIKVDTRTREYVERVRN
jgi:elongation factor P